MTLATAAKQEKEQLPDPVPCIRVTQTVSIPLKYIALFVLVWQTSTLVLLMRHSRIVRTGSKTYLSSTAVVCTEIVKLTICFVVLLKTASLDVNRTMSDIYMESVHNWREAAKLAIPAGLYTVQNNLLFVALSHLDSATYQVTYQLKILTTALFSVAMLRRRLNGKKWCSLVVLMAGVCLVQWPTSTDNSKSSMSLLSSSHLIGVVAVLLSCLSSGFSGVYFEKLLKGSKVSMWMRNIQLAFFSVIFGCVAMCINDTRKISEDGFFQGYDAITWMVIILQACGGLLVAVVVKYADNILKGFATSISIIVSSLLAYFLLGDFVPTWSFVLGASAVLFATYLYSLPAKASAST